MRMGRRLRLERLGAAYGEHAVLAAVSLTAPLPGIVVLLGPAGSGKSTLLRTMAGVNDALPDFRRTGEIRLHDAPLDPREVVLVRQNARLAVHSVRENLASALPDRNELDLPAQDARIAHGLESMGAAALLERLEDATTELPLVDHRLVALAGAWLSGRELVLVDEPFRSIADDEVPRLLGALRQLGETRGVVVATHHQGHARALGGHAVLIDGGLTLEEGPTRAFFDAPSTTDGQTFVRSGRTGRPSLRSSPGELAAETPAPPQIPASLRVPHHGPRDFFWVHPGRLGGCPRPGIVRSARTDLAALRDLGVSTLITLEERVPFEVGELEAAGFVGLHVPIVDMEAPSLATAWAHCEDVAARVHAGEVVALHCLAGLGRTGTMLAAQLIFEGVSAVAAVDRVRAARPRAIQSPAQEDFLVRFESCVRGNND